MASHLANSVGGNSLPGLQGRQSGLCLVPQTGAMPAKISGDNVFAPPFWSARQDGDGRANSASQGSRLDRGQWLRH